MKVVIKPSPCVINLRGTCILSEQADSVHDWIHYHSPEQ